MNLFLTPYTKIKSMWTDLNVKAKTIRALLRRKYGVNLYDLGRTKNSYM